MDEAAIQNAVAQRKKDKSLTWQPYLPHDDKQDIQEIYERLDVDSKGYITQQELHAALNEALGKPVRAETVRALALRMDVTSRRGQHVSYNDFVEYMAQKLLVKESYDDLMRTEQGSLMREVGYKLHEVLSMYKRKQMIKDAMMGSDGIARLLHLTNVPVQHRSRRKGQTGTDLLRNEATGAAGAQGTTGPAARNRPQRPASGIAKAGGGLASTRNDASRNSSVAFRALGLDEPDHNSIPSTSAAASRKSIASVPSSASVAKSKSSRSRQSARQSGGAAARAALSASSAGGRLSDEREREREREREKDREREPVLRWRKGMGLPATEDSSAAVAWAAGDATVFVSELSSLNTRLKEGLATSHRQHQQHTTTLPPRQPSSATTTPNSAGSAPASPTGGANGPAAAPVSSGAVGLGADGAAPKRRPFSTTSTATPPSVLVPRGPPLGVAIPVRSSSRSASPAPSPLGPACQLLIGGAPVAPSGLPWRSAALHSQVLELEHVGTAELQPPGSDDPHAHGPLPSGLGHSHGHLPQHKLQLRKPPGMWVATRGSAPAPAAATGPMPSATSPSRPQTFSSQQWAGGPAAVPANVRSGGSTATGYMPLLSTPQGGVRSASTTGDSEAGSFSPQAQAQAALHQLQHYHQVRNHPSQQGFALAVMVQPSLSLPLPSSQPHPHALHQSPHAPSSQPPSDEERKPPATEGAKRAWAAEDVDMGQWPLRASLSGVAGPRGRPPAFLRTPSAEARWLEVSGTTAQAWQPPERTPVQQPVQPPPPPQQHHHQQQTRSRRTPSSPSYPTGFDRASDSQSSPWSHHFNWSLVRNRSPWRQPPHNL